MGFLNGIGGKLIVTVAQMIAYSITQDFKGQFTASGTNKTSLVIKPYRSVA